MDNNPLHSRIVPLPPVDETIQREVARGRSMVEKTSWGFNPSENQKPNLKTNPENSRQANLENPDSRSNSSDGPHWNLENKGKKKRKNLMLEADEEKRLKVIEREMGLGIIGASKKFQLWKSKLTWRTKSKVQIFDPNNEIDQLNLFLDLLFKPEK